MIASAQTRPPPVHTPTLCNCEGWTIHEYTEVSSTNLVAANLPPWTAVRADTQSAGRGRFERAWISDRGGLWLSAVVPLEAEAIKLRAVPLAAGLAVCNSLRELGVAQLRLRWPNDILVNDQKLAGLLIDHFVPGLAVIGIGINVQNQPEALEPILKGQTARLADLLAPAPASRRRVPPLEEASHLGVTPLLPSLPHSMGPTVLRERAQAIPELHVLTALVLGHLRLVLTQLRQLGTMSLFLRVNELWAGPRRVELDLDGTVRRGLFGGVDEEGRLVLSDETGHLTFYDGHEVRHLTET